MPTESTVSLCTFTQLLYTGQFIEYAKSYFTWKVMVVCGNYKDSHVHKVHRPVWMFMMFLHFCIQTVHKIITDMNRSLLLCLSEDMQYFSRELWSIHFFLFQNPSSENHRGYLQGYMFQYRYPSVSSFLFFTIGNLVFTSLYCWDLKLGMRQWCMLLKD